MKQQQIKMSFKKLTKMPIVNSHFLSRKNEKNKFEFFQNMHILQLLRHAHNFLFSGRNFVFFSFSQFFGAILNLDLSFQHILLYTVNYFTLTFNKNSNFFEKLSNFFDLITQLQKFFMAILKRK